MELNWPTCNPIDYGQAIFEPLAGVSKRRPAKNRLKITLPFTDF